MDVAISINLLKIKWQLKARLPLQTDKIRQVTILSMYRYTSSRSWGIRHKNRPCAAMLKITGMLATWWFWWFWWSWWSECHGRAVWCNGFVFWWPSRQNVGSNPGRDRGACVPEQDTLLWLHLFTQEYKWGRVRAEMVTVFDWARCATHLAAWAAYSPGCWDGSRNDNWPDDRSNNICAMRVKLGGYWRNIIVHFYFYYHLLINKKKHTAWLYNINKCAFRAITLTSVPKKWELLFPLIYASIGFTFKICIIEKLLLKCKICSSFIFAFGHETSTWWSEDRNSKLE